ncbi:MAG: hypothetical protein IIX34_04100, partial [Alistipes sp.]|nr:hypothetical protein [Alistipes sp.]
MRRVLTLIVAVVALMACSSEEFVEVRYLASERPETYLYAADEQGENLTVADTLVRGAQLNVVVNGKKRFNDVEYLPVKVEKQTLYAPLSSL